MAASTKTRAATIKGVFLVPGVSKNRRLYTAEMIASAVAGMKESLKDAPIPLTMYTSHAKAGEDDALATVGLLADAWVDENGNGCYEAHIANTSQGRDIAVLAEGKFLRSVSIRGEFTGDMETIEYEGQKVVTAPGLIIHGIDFTSRPGVTGANVDHVASTMESAVAQSNPHFICEATDDAEIFFEEIPAETKTVKTVISEAIAESLEGLFEESEDGKNLAFADNGYLEDHKKRLPLDSENNVRASWASISQEETAKVYTAPQQKRIKSKIKAASKKLGFDVAEEYESFIADVTDAIEAYASVHLSTGGGASIDVSGWVEDPSKLRAAATRITSSALVALFALDPNGDGDIDGVDADSDESSKAPVIPTESKEASGSCSSCGATDSPNGALYCPTCGNPIAAAESKDAANDHTKENAMADETVNNKPADGSDAPKFALTAEDHAAIAAQVIAGFQSAEEAKVAKTEADRIAAEEAEANRTYTKDEVASLLAQRTTEATEAASAAAVEAFRKAGAPRAGLSESGSDTNEAVELDSNVLAEMTPEELTRFAGESWGKTGFFKRLYERAN